MKPERILNSLRSISCCAFSFSMGNSSIFSVSLRHRMEGHTFLCFLCLLFCLIRGACSRRGASRLAMLYLFVIFRLACLVRFLCILTHTKQREFWVKEINTFLCVFGFPCLLCILLVLLLKSISNKTPVTKVKF